MEPILYVTRLASGNSNLREALDDPAYIVATNLAYYLDPDGFFLFRLDDFSYRCFPNSRKAVHRTKNSFEQLTNIGLIAVKNIGLSYLLAAPALRSHRFVATQTVDKLCEIRPDLKSECDALKQAVKVTNLKALKCIYNRDSCTKVREWIPATEDSCTKVRESKFSPEQNQTLTPFHEQPIRNSIIKSMSTTSETHTHNFDAYYKGNEEKQAQPLVSFENRFLNPEVQPEIEDLLRQVAINSFSSVILHKRAHELSVKWTKLGLHDRKHIESVIKEVWVNVRAWCERDNKPPSTKVDYFIKQVEEGLRGQTKNA